MVAFMKELEARQKLDVRAAIAQSEENRADRDSPPSAVFFDAARHFLISCPPTTIMREDRKI